MRSNPAQLFVVEDDAHLRAVLVRTLRAEGFEVTATAGARELLGRLGEPGAPQPDALLIDIGLPDGDGRDLCQALRARGVQAPVLFLTARDALTDRLSGFRAGADDYITKPYDLEEVLLRIEAILRRQALDPEAGAAPSDGLLLDPVELTAATSGTSATLTPTEFRLLGALVARQGRVLTRAELVATAWPHGAIVHDNTLDVYVARVRRKLATLPGAPIIATLHGRGYRLDA